MLPAFASGNSSIAMDRHKKITISHQIAMDRHKQIAKRPSRSQSPSPPCEAPVIYPRIVLVPPFVSQSSSSSSSRGDFLAYKMYKKELEKEPENEREDFLAIENKELEKELEKEPENERGDFLAIENKEIEKEPENEPEKELEDHLCKAEKWVEDNLARIFKSYEKEPEKEDEKELEDDFVEKDKAEEMSLKPKSRPKAKPALQKDGTYRTYEARGPATHLSWMRGLPSDFIPIGPQP